MKDPKTKKRPDTPLAATPAVDDSTVYYNKQAEGYRKIAVKARDDAENAEKKKQETFDVMRTAQKKRDAYNAKNKPK